MNNHSALIFLSAQSLPLTAEAHLRLFIGELAQEAFDLELSRELVESELNMLGTVSSRNQLRAARLAWDEVEAAAINALNAVEL